MFTKDELKRYRTELAECVKEFEKKNDVKVDFGNISYTDFEFTLKTKVVKNEVNGEDAQKLIFAKSCKSYGLNAEDYQRGISVHTRNGLEKYKLLGFENKRSKYCIRLESLKDGKVYLLPQSVLDGIAYKDFKLTQTHFTQAELDAEEKAVMMAEIRMF